MDKLDLGTAAIAIAGVVLTSGAAYANQLPECDSPEVRNTLQSILQTNDIRRSDDLKADTPDKRWCTAIAMVPYRTWASTARMWYDQYRPTEVTYTIEWINEAEGRFWVQTQ